MTRSQYTVFPPSTRIYDVICAYLAGEISEGFLRDMFASELNFDGDATRAMWFDAVERGKEYSDAWSRAKNNAAHSMKCSPADLGSASGSETASG